MHPLNTNEEMKMYYTIVWNENKTEGIILSGENAGRDAMMATLWMSNGQYSTLAGEFYETYGEFQKCTIQNNVEIK